jgi:hypothetical protein
MTSQFIAGARLDPSPIPSRCLSRSPSFLLYVRLVGEESPLDDLRCLGVSDREGRDRWELLKREVRYVVLSVPVGDDEVQDDVLTPPSDKA